MCSPLHSTAGALANQQSLVPVASFCALHHFLFSIEAFVSAAAATSRVGDIFYSPVSPKTSFARSRHYLNFSSLGMYHVSTMAAEGSQGPRRNRYRRIRERGLHRRGIPTVSPVPEDPSSEQIAEQEEPEPAEEEQPSRFRRIRNSHLLRGALTIPSRWGTSSSAQPNQPESSERAGNSQSAGNSNSEPAGHSEPAGNSEPSVDSEPAENSETAGDVEPTGGERHIRFHGIRNSLLGGLRTNPSVRGTPSATQPVTSQSAGGGRRGRARRIRDSFLRRGFRPLRPLQRMLPLPKQTIQKHLNPLQGDREAGFIGFAIASFAGGVQLLRPPQGPLLLLNQNPPSPPPYLPPCPSPCPLRGDSEAGFTGFVISFFFEGS